MSELKIFPERRKRRRRSDRRQSAVGWRGFITDRRFGRVLFTIMVVVLVIYVAGIIYAARTATYFYDGLQLGISRTEVRYLYGDPDESDAAQSRWSYTGEGRRLTAHFDPGGRVDSIACSSVGDSRFACPDILGLRVGSSEDMVTRALGPPDREVFGSTTKTMYYQGLGLAFHMRLYLVEQIEVRRGASVPGYVWRALWMMVP